MRVVITGMGIVSPLGNDPEAYWQALIGGHSGVSLINNCCLDQLNCHFAGQISDLNTDAFFNSRQLRRWDRFCQLATIAAKNAVKPFDKNRTGFILSEGAAAIVVESLDSAIRHNKKISCEISGFGSNCDAYHLTAPAKDGKARAIQLALDDAAIMPEQIDYINAHGTATRMNDPVKTHAISNSFGFGGSNAVLVIKKWKN